MAKPKAEVEISKMITFVKGHIETCIPKPPKNKLDIKKIQSVLKEIEPKIQELISIVDTHVASELQTDKKTKAPSPNSRSSSKVSTCQISFNEKDTPKPGRPTGKPAGLTHYTRTNSKPMPKDVGATKEKADMYRKDDESKKPRAEITERKSSGIPPRPSSASSKHGIASTKTQPSSTPGRQKKELEGKPRNHPIHENTVNDDFNHKQRENELISLKKQIQDLESKTSEQDRRIKDMTENMNRLKEERDDINTRFSKLAANNLIKNNADIADLGDKYRAEKIADLYAILYDDAWTDAFLALRKGQKRKEEEIVQNLLSLLQECYIFCQNASENQLTMIINLHCNPVQQMDIKNGASSMRQTQPTEEQIYELKRFRKDMAVDKIDGLKESFFYETKKRHGEEIAKKSQSYCFKCVEVCWPMVLHQPPIYLDDKILPGSQIDTGRYTQRSSGQMIASLVWPSLVLGEERRLLRKGVVEGK